MDGLNELHEKAVDVLSQPSSKFVVTGVRRLFYLVTPNETSFAHPDDVPRYVDEVIPFFMGFITLEFIVCLLTGRRHMRINDLVSSVSSGVFLQLPLLFIRSIEISAYIWVWNCYRVYELPWDSALTWWFALIGVDFGYYWFHRMAHEINLFWAAHQVHHSSEDYNLTTALRQSVVQRYSSWIFYIPMAFFVPPAVFMVHSQFNLLYQFWIHTEVIRTLGPLELILNTPSHHRVHHGRNRYCIDKNYAGTFIIWDRMFGTFGQEDEEVVYGLTHSINTWGLWKTQILHFQWIYQRFGEVSGLGNKLSVIFKGPGWDIGKPRTGCIEDIPDVKAPIVKYNSHISSLGDLYVLFHFLLILASYSQLALYRKILDESTVIAAAAFVLISLTIFGKLLDNNPMAPMLEAIRCSSAAAIGIFLIQPVTASAAAPDDSSSTVLLTNVIQSHHSFALAIIAIFAASGIGWTLRSVCFSPPNPDHSKED